MGEAGKPRPLSEKQRRFIAAYIGEANGNATHAARLAGYKGNDVTLATVGSQNLRNLQIASQIAEHQAAIKRKGIAHQQNRIDAIVRRHQLLEQIMTERAEEYRHLRAERAADPTPQSDLDKLLGRRSVPAGGETGLLIRKVRAVGEMIAEEFAIDTSLLDELLKHEADIAKELGERVEKREITGADGEPLTIMALAVPKPAAERHER